MSPKDPPTAELTGSSRSSSTVSELRASASMCHHCFDVLVRELHKKETTTTSPRNNNYTDALSNLLDIQSKPEFVDHIPPGELECPLFVTWDKERLQHNGSSPKKFELRGCIGTHAPKPLHPSIGEYALLSALKDKRFQPVSLAELPLLRVAVSLLIRYEPCEHCHDWVVGLHGVIITFIIESRGREYSATYLPEVAADQGWDQAAAIESLIRKAGYHGRITSALLQQLQCTRYQSSKTRVTFDEYLQVRGEPVRKLLSQASSTASGTGAANIDSSSRPQHYFRRDGSGRDSNCIIS